MAPSAWLTASGLLALLLALEQGHLASAQLASGTCVPVGGNWQVYTSKDLTHVT